MWCADTVDREGNGVRRIERVVFDGTEKWKFIDGNYPYYALDIGNYGYVVATGEGTNGYCSHFPVGIVASNIEGNNIICTLNSMGNNAARITCRPDIDTVTDLATWKSWLAEQHSAGTPVRAFCILAEPETFTLSADEISQLKSLHTYKPVTNIYNSDGGYQRVTYLKDTPEADYIGGLEARIAALEAAT